MQAQLKEMFLVLRPTSKGHGNIPLQELETVLKALGFDFLVTPEQIPQMKVMLDRENRGIFQEDELIEYLIKNYAKKYTEAQALREAFKQFDFDNDGKIGMEEFEYFMKNFGVQDNHTHMDEKRLEKLFKICKDQGLDANGQMDIEKLVKVLTMGWQK